MLLGSLVVDGVDDDDHVVDDDDDEVDCRPWGSLCISYFTDCMIISPLGNRRPSIKLFAVRGDDCN